MYADPSQANTYNWWRYPSSSRFWRTIYPSEQAYRTDDAFLYPDSELSDKTPSDVIGKRFLASVIVVSVVLSIGLALGIGLYFGLKDDVTATTDSPAPENFTNVFGELVLETTFTADLLDSNSDAHEQLQQATQEYLDGACAAAYGIDACPITELTFSNGSVIVSLRIRIPAWITDISPLFSALEARRTQFARGLIVIRIGSIIIIIVTNVDICSSNALCANGGTCRAVGSSYACVCQEQWTGRRCQEEVPLCETSLNTCLNGATCQVVGNDVICLCTPEYTGLECESTLAVETTSTTVSSSTTESSSSSTSVTPPAASSTTTDSTSSTTSHTTTSSASTSTPELTTASTTLEATTSTSTQTSTISSVPPTTTMTIASTTEVMMSSSTPTTSVFTTNEMQETSTASSTSPSAACSSSPCESGSCVDVGPSFQCLCQEGRTGELCQTDIDECSSDPCLNSASCSDRPGGYECLCELGYTGDLCQTDVDDCDAADCANDATCVDDVNSYSCSCVEGFTGGRCETDIDECDSSLCLNGGTCEDGINMYSCMCTEAYTGTLCESDVDFCIDALCENNGTCIDDVSNYTCVCQGGYTGALCETELSECGSSPCQHNGTCEDLINMYSCICGAGYTGGHCEEDIDECMMNPCANHSTCEDLIDDFMCVCAAGYTGGLCEEDIDECMMLNPCQNNGTCMDGVANVTCECDAAFTGSYCETEVDECAVAECSNTSTCIDLVGGYECVCSDGYTGELCDEDVDECMMSECENNSTCIDLVNNYTCQCDINFTGNFCQTELFCTADDVCMNGATCEESVDGPFCVCAENYTGESCQYGLNDAFWSNWTSCDVTCGEGVEERYCEGPACPTETQQRRCGTALCVQVQAALGLWSTWAKFGSCSRSCGGGVKVRTRTCQLEGGQTSCVGDSTQESNCNTFDCISCSSLCPSGYTLNSACTYCECNAAGAPISATVLTQEGAPVQGVSVYVAGSPTSIVSTSDAEGAITINGLCRADEVTLEKQGYEEVTLRVEDVGEVITLSRYRLLSVETSPVTSRRLVGEHLRLCCSFSGSEDPTSVEWFKNGQVVFDDTSNAFSSTYLLTNLVKDDEGLYRCRANTESSAVSTESAFVIVKDHPDDFCLTRPRPNQIPLPSDCDQQGNPFVDVGSCTPGWCRVAGQSTGGGQCPEPETHCCGPTEGYFRIVQCQNYEYQVYVITTCGCNECSSPSIDITGSVIDGETGGRLPDIDIFYKSSIIARSDDSGQFYMTVSPGTTRVGLTAIDESGDYVTATKVLRIPSDGGGLFEMTLDLLRSPDPIVVNSQTANNLAMSQGGGESMGELSLEAGRFYDEDGSPYEGEVSVRLSVLHPDDPRLANAPGDFTTTDTEGEDVAMMSQGMFFLDLRSPNGTQLSIPSFTVTAPPSLPDPDQIQVFFMNEDTGKWDLASPTESSRRKKRNAILGVTYDYRLTWCNFDYVTSTTCHSKARVFEDDSYNDFDQVKDVRISVIIEDQNGARSLSQIRPYNDDPDNGYCIIHRCSKVPGDSNTFIGYFSAFYQTLYAYPAAAADISFEPGLDYQADIPAGQVGGTARINLDLAESGFDGPIYDWNLYWRNSDGCRRALISERHLKFYLPEVLRCSRSLQLIELGTQSLPPLCQENLYLLWNSAAQHRANQFTSCFMRVNVNTFDSTQVAVASRNLASIAAIGYDRFGIQYACVKGDYGCVEVKKPDNLGCSSDASDDIVSDVVLIDLQVLDSSSNPLELTSVKEALVTAGVIVAQDTTSLQFNLQASMLSDRSLGIYCEQGQVGQSVESVRSQARITCQQDPDHTHWIAEFAGSSQVRLSGPRAPQGEGRVEVLYLGQYRLVCGNRYWRPFSGSWGEEEAQVVCRDLGFSFDRAYFTSEYERSIGYGRATPSIGDVACTGSESNLAECDYNIYNGVDRYCFSYSAAIVQCARNSDFLPLTLRLTNGINTDTGAVEVRFSGQTTWGAICDDGWGENEARVACRELGYPADTLISAVRRSFYPPSTSLYALGSVRCTGSESSLADCSHVGFGIVDTSRCYSGTAAGIQCIDSDIHLTVVNGSSSSEGNIELLIDGQTGLLCDTNWGPADARVVCTYLGFGDDRLAFALTGSPFGSSSDQFLLDDLDCEGSETELAQCSNPGLGVIQPRCFSGTVAGVKCVHLEDDPGPYLVVTESDTIGIFYVPSKDFTPLLPDLFDVSRVWSLDVDLLISAVFMATDSGIVGRSVDGDERMEDESVITHEAHQCFALTLDRTAQLIFYSCYFTDSMNYKLKRMTYNFTEDLQLIESPDFITYDITLDVVNSVVYYTSYTFAEVISIDYTGNNEQVLWAETSGIMLYGISYLASGQNRSVYWCGTSEASNSTQGLTISVFKHDVISGDIVTVWENSRVTEERRCSDLVATATEVLVLIEEDSDKYIITRAPLEPNPNAFHYDQFAYYYFEFEQNFGSSYSSSYSSEPRESGEPAPGFGIRTSAGYNTHRASMAIYPT